MQKLRSFFEHLEYSKKYFTVCQYDDGILADRGAGGYRVNCKVFGAGGYGDVAIPLVCDEHTTEGIKWKKYLASFAGSIKTHNVRQQMFDELGGNDAFYLVDTYGQGKENMPNFIRNIEESYFVLCPRGYGKTSYRLYEVMQCGAIPVYISDEHWLPFADFINWEEFCIVIRPEQMKDLPDTLHRILESDVYAAMKKNVQEVYRNYFAYEACFKMISRILEKEHGVR